MYPNSELLRFIEPQIEKIDNWGYGNLNFNARYKWANIMAIFHETYASNIDDLRIVDIGGGLGPLDLYFSNFGTVVNFDLNHDSTWFETNSNGLAVGSVGPEVNENNLHRVTGDFLNIIETIESSSIDFVYDSCSAIHISRKFRKIDATGLQLGASDAALLLTFKEIRRILKPTGVFAFATDVAHPRSSELKDMIHANRYLTLALMSGLAYDVNYLGTEYTQLKNDQVKNFDSFIAPRRAGKFDYQRTEDNISHSLNLKWPTTTVISTRTTVICGEMKRSKDSAKLRYISTKRILLLKIRQKLTTLLFNIIDEND